MINIVWRDLVRGFRSNWYKYIIGIFFICLFLIINLVLVKKMNIVNSGLFDKILYILKGMREYIPDSMNKFQIPVVWMFVQFICSFLVYHYLYTDLEGRGLDILMKSGSRKLWWFSKCIWCVSSILVFYLLIYLSCIIFTLITSNGDVSLTTENFSKILGSHLNAGNSLQILCALLLIPLFTSISLSLMQLCISVITGPVISILIILSIELLSAYFMRVYMVGNYSMIVRSSLVVQNGISPGVAVGVNTGIIIISVIAGTYLFQRKDILEKD